MSEDVQPEDDTSGGNARASARLRRRKCRPRQLQKPAETPAPAPEAPKQSAAQAGRPSAGSAPAGARAAAARRSSASSGAHWWRGRGGERRRGSRWRSSATAPRQSARMVIVPGGERGGDGDGAGPVAAGPLKWLREIELEKLISDSLYLDNQAHAVVARMRDMDSGTKSQLRRLYNAVRRAVRAPESERQHQFVMLRARLAYTIARHSLRSLDALERLLLQVTRRNDARGYERFKDLFEAIVAYNE